MANVSLLVVSSTILLLAILVQAEQRFPDPSVPGHAAFLEIQRSALGQLDAPDFLVGLEAGFVVKRLASNMTSSLNATASEWGATVSGFVVTFDDVGILISVGVSYLCSEYGNIEGQLSGYAWPSLSQNVVKLQPQLTNITIFEGHAEPGPDGFISQAVRSAAGYLLSPALSLANSAFSLMVPRINGLLPPFEYLIDPSTAIPINKSFELKPSAHVRTVHVTTPPIGFGPAAIYTDRNGIQVLAKARIGNETHDSTEPKTTALRPENFTQAVRQAFGSVPTFTNRHDAVVKVSDSFIHRFLDSTVKSGSRLDMLGDCNDTRLNCIFNDALQNFTSSLVTEPYDLGFRITKETIEGAMIPLSSHMQTLFPTFLLQRVALGPQQISSTFSFDSSIPKVGSASFNVSLAFIPSVNTSHIVLQPFLASLAVHQIDYGLLNVTIDDAVQVVNQVLNSSLALINDHLLAVSVDFGTELAVRPLDFDLPWCNATISVPNISSIALLITDDGVQGMIRFVLPGRDDPARAATLALKGRPAFEEIRSSFWAQWSSSSFPANSRSHVYVSPTILVDYLRGYLPQRTANDVKASAVEIAQKGLAEVSRTPDFEMAISEPFLTTFMESWTSRLDDLTVDGSALGTVGFAKSSASLGEQSIALSTQVRVDTLTPAAHIRLRVNSSAICSVADLNLTCFLYVQSLEILDAKYQGNAAFVRVADVVSSVASFLPAIVAAINGAPPISIPLAVPEFDPLPVDKLAGGDKVKLSGEPIDFPILQITSASLLVDADGIFIIGTLEVKPPSGDGQKKKLPPLKLPKFVYHGTCAAAKDPAAYVDSSAEFLSFRSAFLARSSIKDRSKTLVSIQKTRLAEVLNGALGAPRTISAKYDHKHEFDESKKIELHDQMGFTKRDCDELPSCYSKRNCEDEVPVCHDQRRCKSPSECEEARSECSSRRHCTWDCKVPDDCWGDRDCNNRCYEDCHHCFKTFGKKVCWDDPICLGRVAACRAGCYASNHADDLACRARRLATVAQCNVDKANCDRLKVQEDLACGYEFANCNAERLACEAAKVVANGECGARQVEARAKCTAAAVAENIACDATRAGIIAGCHTGNVFKSAVKQLGGIGRVTFKGSVDGTAAGDFHDISFKADLSEVSLTADLTVAGHLRLIAGFSPYDLAHLVCPVAFELKPTEVDFSLESHRLHLAAKVSFNDTDSEVVFETLPASLTMLTDKALGVYILPHLPTFMLHCPVTSSLAFTVNAISTVVALKPEWITAALRDVHTLPIPSIEFRVPFKTTFTDQKLALKLAENTEQRLVFQVSKIE